MLASVSIKPMDIAFEITVILTLIVVNGLLSMAEMAIVSARKARLRELADKGDAGAIAALAVANRPDFLSTIQVGITLIGVIAGVFSGATLADIVAAWFAVNLPALAQYADAIGLAIVVVPVTFVSLIIGELVPKRLALISPERMAARVARPIQLLTTLLHPAVWVLDHATQLILTLMRVDRSQEPPVTEEEFKILIEQGAQAGVFDKTEETAMKRVLGFWDLRVGDLMTPRVRVAAIDLNWSLTHIFRAIAEAPHHYYPVHEGDIDNLLGVLSTKHLAELQGKAISVARIKACVRKSLVVPETMISAKLLERFRATGQHVAIVVDEHGGTSGIVATSDLLEAILGDLPGSEPENANIVQRADGSWLVDGMFPLRQLEFELGFQLPSPDESIITVGGWMMARLGRIPREGDIAEAPRLSLEVMDMDGNRVDKVLVTARNE